MTVDEGESDATAGRNARAWIALDASHDPLRSLILGVVFPGYLVGKLFLDPAAGQAAWGIALAVAAAVSAVLAPLAGRALDRTGATHLMLRFAAIALVLFSASLWFAVPGVNPWVFLTLAMLIAVVVDLYMTLINSTLAAAAAGQAARLSSLGYVGGQIGSLIAFSTVFLVTEAAWVPSSEDGRIAGPVGAALIVASFFAHLVLSTRGGAFEGQGATLPAARRQVTPVVGTIPR